MIRAILRRLFLVKEIKSKEGVVHFLRYRLLWTPWFKIYLHKICRSDEDAHMHDHPWNFVSLILWGGYKEWARYPKSWCDEFERVHFKWHLIQHHHEDAHKIELITPHVWSLVFAGRKDHPWGYQTEFGWIEHQDYREWKRNCFPPREMVSREKVIAS